QQKFGDLAKDCAAHAADGDNCTNNVANNGGSLIVSPPQKIVRLEPCTLPFFRERHGTQANTCNSVAHLQGQCVCIACVLFQNAPYNVFPQGPIDQCVGMPANADVSVHFSGRERLAHAAHDHWFTFVLHTGSDDRKKTFTIFSKGNQEGNSTDL